MMKAGRTARGRGKGPNLGRERGAARFGEAQQSKESAALTPREFTIQVPPDRVNAVLQSLEREVPQQVQVAMMFSPSDLPQVQRMVAPVGPAAPPPEEPEFVDSGVAGAGAAPVIAEAGESGRGRGVAPSAAEAFEGGDPGDRVGGRGRVMREAVQPKRGARSAGAAVEQPAEVPAGVAAPLQQAQRRQALGELDVVDEAEEPAERVKKEAPAESESLRVGPRYPRVADVAKPVSEALSQGVAVVGRAANEAARQADTGVKPEMAGAFMVEHGSELRDHLNQAYERMFSVAPGSSSEVAQAGSGSVTLRVTVLPPPPATQPAPGTLSSQPP
jgi:hypothetical protein